MSQSIQFRDIPRSLDDEEIPFVMGFGIDSRPSLVTSEAVYRRANDKVMVEFVVEETLRLRALSWEIDDRCIVVATAGPLLYDWWPLLQEFPTAPERPVLSAAAKGRKIVMTNGDIALPITVSSMPDPRSVVARFGITGGLTAENIDLSRAVALPVIKASLLALSEHSTLTNRVPEANVVQNGVTLSLAEMIGAAAELANWITWESRID